MTDPVREALAELVRVIDAAGLYNLSRGVELGPTVWFVKASDAIDAARAALAGPAGEPQKYDDTLLPFLALMRNELHENARKGDRPGWLTMSREQALLEIYWHTAKLSAAVKNGDAAATSEHAADVANMAMMLLDVCGGLNAQPEEPSEDPARLRLATTADQQRQRFEAWAKPLYFPFVKTQFLKRGVYANKLVQAMWLAWQAALSGAPDAAKAPGATAEGGKT